ncbi:hypothetical protein ASE35_01795 [Lysobacter sp. Root916]|uniref:hypothetical protein n=1 Tax=Lysobacter sp. Root916 TaxID=1736606 RepID=UPI00070E4EE3|nr:hypothetical protein [Lysobacter sp. Root916]KRD39134.1 hypothetical protein ASE35_01795 [Lysobacter sp. Root916]
MWDLFKAELLRFRAWAIAYAAVQLVVLGFMSRVVDLAQQSYLVYQVIGIVYAVSGLLLGLYQMGGYRRPNAWLNLLHRPLPHARVALALVGAGALLLAIAVLLPLLLVAAWQEFMTARVLDLRHLLLAASGLLLALCAYLAGGYAMLADKRYGWSALVLVFGLLIARATGLGAIALQLYLLIVLAAMLLIAFKPDLSAPPRNAAAALLTAIPLQFALWFALVIVGFGVEFVWIAQGSHPNNMAVAPPGGEKEAEFSEGRDLMRMGLAGSRDPQAELWREQALISEIYGTGPGLRGLPQRNQLTNREPMEFDDETQRQRWVFSHDRMRFEGYSLVDKRAVGSLGVDGDAAFPQPVQPGPEGLLVARDAVYQYDSDARRVLPRARLPRGEVLTGLDKVGDSAVLLSDRALYFYDLRELDNDDGVLKPRQRVALPGRSGDLVRIDLMELLDGYLVSFLFTYASHNAEGVLPYQQLLRVDDAGRTTPVARRQLSLDYPIAWRYQNWYTSPLLYRAQKALLALHSGYLPERDMATPPAPRTAQWIAGALLLLSVLGALWRLPRTALSRPARIAWLAACAALGLPALMSLWLIYRPRETLDELPSAQAAMA